LGTNCRTNDIILKTIWYVTKWLKWITGNRTYFQYSNITFLNIVDGTKTQTKVPLRR
jgi:hypothetical protein